MGKGADRVKVSTLTTGTGTYQLVDVAATGGYITVAQAVALGYFASGDKIEYGVGDGTNFEICEGVVTVGSPDIIVTRGTVRQSSNSGAAVNWGAGSKDFWLNDPASKLSFADVFAFAAAHG